MPQRTNGGVFNDQILTGSLKHFTVKGANFQGAIDEFNRPVTGSAAEIIYTLIAQKATIVIMDPITNSKGMSFALETNRADWDAARLQSAIRALGTIGVDDVDVSQVIVEEGAFDLLGGGSDTFLELTDTPTDYTSFAGFNLVVNQTEDGIAFVAGTGGGGNVLSVFGRDGNVVAETGDYSSDLITNDSSVTGTTVSEALDNISNVSGTALQPGDDISELVNDTGYITLADLPEDAVISVDGRSGIVTLTDLYAPVIHTHVETDITDLDKYTQAEVDLLLTGKAEVVHTHIETDITDLDKYTQAEVDALIFSGSYTDLTDVPTEFTPEAHTHVELDITDLDKYTQAEVDLLLTGKAEVVHTHVETDITDLDKYTQAEVDLLLSGKAELVHTHVKGDITDFSDADYATSAQGLLADTALQTNDNVSELTNDTGYITIVDVPVDEAPQDGTPYSRQDAGWVPAGTGGGGDVISVDGRTGVVTLDDLYAPIVHTHIKTDIIDFSDADYATSAQGLLADTALQVVASDATITGDGTAGNPLSSLNGSTGTGLSVIDYQYTGVSANTDPGPGNIANNNADPVLVTEIYLSTTDDNGDVRQGFGSLTGGDVFSLIGNQAQNNGTFNSYSMTNNAVNNGNYFTIPVRHLNNNGVFSPGFGVQAEAVLIPIKNFINLKDVFPANYVGASGQFVSVNSAETGVEFANALQDITSESISELSDVDISEILTGQILEWDGVQFIPGNKGTSGGGAVDSVFGRTGNIVSEEGDYDLDLLEDVSLDNPLPGQVLVYDGTEWKNAPPPTASSGAGIVDGGQLSMPVNGFVDGGTFQ